MKEYILRIRNNGFRNNEIDDMGIFIITTNKNYLINEISHIIELGNIDFHVTVTNKEEE